MWPQSVSNTQTTQLSFTLKIEVLIPLYKDKFMRKRELLASLCRTTAVTCTGTWQEGARPRRGQAHRRARGQSLAHPTPDSAQPAAPEHVGRCHAGMQGCLGECPQKFCQLYKLRLPSVPTLVATHPARFRKGETFHSPTKRAFIDSLICPFSIPLLWLNSFPRWVMEGTGPWGPGCATSRAVLLGSLTGNIKTVGMVMANATATVAAVTAPILACTPCPRPPLGPHRRKLLAAGARMPSCQALNRALLHK